MASHQVVHWLVMLWKLGMTSVLLSYPYQYLVLRCHLGKSVVFDTIGKMGWSADIRTHPIKTVIERILSQDWDAANNLAVPVAKQEADCQVST
jgi:putative lipase involved disintegration of autophagic bodies